MRVRRALPVAVKSKRKNTARMARSFIQALYTGPENSLLPMSLLCPDLRPYVVKEEINQKGNNHDIRSRCDPLDVEPRLPTWLPSPHRIADGRRTSPGRCPP